MERYVLEQIERVELRSYGDSDEEEPFYLLTLVVEKHVQLVLWGTGSCKRERKSLQ